jgi:hypothetical protein
MVDVTAFLDGLEDDGLDDGAPEIIRVDEP